MALNGLAEHRYLHAPQPIQRPVLIARILIEF